MANDLSNDPAYSSNSNANANANPSAGSSGSTGNGSTGRAGSAGGQQRFERAVSGAHEAVDSAAESIAQAAEILRDKANRLGEMEKEYAEACRTSVREHPLSYLAGAVLLGVLIGRLTR
jgi:phage-related tail protein